MRSCIIMNVMEWSLVVQLLLFPAGVSKQLTKVAYPTSRGNKNIPGAEKALYRYLMDDYEKAARPVTRPNKTLLVNIGVKLNQLLDLNERTQVLTTIIALDQAWRDDYLSWNPDDFEGIVVTYLPCNRVWLPDVVLYNSVDDVHQSPYMQSPVAVEHTGRVSWFPLAKLKTSCKLDIRFYPFDKQACYLKLGSWSYSGQEVDLSEGFTGIEKLDFVDNGEFQLLEFEVKRVENVYDCCPHPIITLNVYIYFRRRPMFSLFTVAVPCIMLSLMTSIAFILPPQNEAKVEVQLSVMLSLAVFMLMLGESLLPTSDTVPLLVVHIVIQMGLTALSLICSVFVLRLVHTDYKNVPEMLRRRAVRLAKLLLVGVPDYLKDVHDYRQKMAVIEKHQLEIRMNHLTPGGMKNGVTNAKQLYKTVSTDEATLFSERNTSVSDDALHNKQRLLRQKYGHEWLCTAKQQSKSIELILMKILQHMEDTALKEQRRAEWRLLGSVIDRILLIILLLAALLTIVYIYAIAPSVQSKLQTTN